MKKRTFGNVRLAPDGKMLRDVSSHDGTVEDTQTLRDTPLKQHKAWLYDEGATNGAAADDTGAGAAADDTGATTAAERRKLNSQAVSNVRKKFKAKEKSGEPVRESLSLYAHCLQAFTSGRLARDRSDSRRKEHSPRKPAELSRRF